MEQVMTSYCLECEWMARADRVADRSAAAIEHAVDTGHDIDSIRCLSDVALPHPFQRN